MLSIKVLETVTAGLFWWLGTCCSIFCYFYPLTWRMFGRYDVGAQTNGMTGGACKWGEQYLFPNSKWVIFEANEKVDWLTLSANKTALTYSHSAISDHEIKTCSLNFIFLTRYCWWKKSCTNWYVVCPMIYKVLIYARWLALGILHHQQYVQ